MKKIILIICYLVFSSTLLVGCYFDNEKCQLNKENAKKIKSGMVKSLVIKIMGKPDSIFSTQKEVVFQYYADGDFNTIRISFKQDTVSEVHIPGLIQ